MLRTMKVALVSLAAVGCADIVASDPIDNGGADGPSVGDILTFNVPVLNSPCTAAPNRREGRVAGVTEHTIVVVDVESPVSSLDDADYAGFGRDFERWGYPVVERYFGSPTDLDDNGRVIAFFTSAVNELSDSRGNSVILGVFWPGDLFPPTSQDGVQGCPNSNYAEIFYLAVPDPSGRVGPRMGADAIAASAVSTMGHELQHLVNAARRLYEPPLAPANDLFEAVWLNEGLSHITEELMFYDRAGGDPGQNIDVDWLRGGTTDQRVDAFNEFQAQNLGLFAAFLENTHVADASLLNGNAPLASRGANWHFLRYAADRRGSQAGMWWDLVNTTQSGIANLGAVLGADPHEWIRDWSTAVFADDEAPVPADFRFPSWNLRAIYAAFQANGRPAYPDGYPLAIRALDDGEPVDLQLAGMTAAYLQVGIRAGDTATITFLSGGAEPPPDLQVSAVNAGTGEVLRFAGGEAGAIILEAGEEDATYILIPLHTAAVPHSSLQLRAKSEGATPRPVATTSPAGQEHGLVPLLSTGTGSTPLPAVDHTFHIEFLERAQRELAPLVPYARDEYQRRLMDRRRP